MAAPPVGRLTEEQRKAVVDSWALVEPDATEHGLKFFQHLFSSHPDVQSTFFPMMSANDIVTLGQHGSKIVLAIGGLVHTVRDDDPEALAIKLRMVAISHIPRNVSIAEFKLALKCFIEYLDEALGSDMPEGGPEAWKKFFVAVELILDIELKRGGELKQQWTDN